MNARIDTTSVKSGAIPVYELRAVRHGAGDLELEVWQLASPATPALTEPKRVAGLRGRNLDLVENNLLKQLRRGGIDPTVLRKGDKKAWKLAEDGALKLGLLFRALAPMRRRENISACAVGIEDMGREEAAYWLGMAMHRKNPRRVLTALRILLIDPKVI
ncbi:hypothetical protein WME94_53120 [Sorangium sp. So ce429]